MATQNLLLVEGQDDKHVVINLLFAHQLHERFEVKDKDGITNLVQTLPMELRASELKRIGIMIDADSPMSSRWESVVHALKKAGYANVPTLPKKGGTIVVEAGKPCVGVWLMPNNQDDGKLEDFVALLVPTEDPLLSRAHSAVNSIPHGQRPFAEADTPKASIHTWLAWQPEPGVRMGAAINRKYLASDGPAASEFVIWLEALLAQ